MKITRPLFASFIALSLVLTGCGSFFSEVRDEVASELGISSDDYYEYNDYVDAYDSAVGSLNNYSDLINEAYDEMDYLEYDLFYYTDDIDYYEPSVYEPTFTCLFEMYSYDWLKEVTASPSYELTEDERQRLISKADEIFTVIDTTKENCRDLDRYVSSQDYKDDDFARSQELVDSIYLNMDAYYTLHADMNDLLEEMFEIYENFEVDPNDPISVGIGNMRDDMDLADAIFDILDEAYNSGELTQSAELEAAYNALLASGESHQTDPGIWDEYTLDYYEYFYADLQDDFLPASKVAMRAYNDGNWDDLDYAYWDMSDYYGFLVDDYNTYLDMSGY